MATLKKLMTLLSNQGLVEERAAIIAQFTNGAKSSARQLNASELNTLCTFLENETTKQKNDLDKKRKRLIACIFGVFKLANRKVSMEYVKAIACRAAKEKNFNQIPPARLDSLYSAFLNAQKDLTFSKRLVDGFINEQISYN
ncbi:hypothetical protein AP75_13180 [Kaistella haifensis DSM 19056]|uniref:DUF1018 domain-containing protein n=1 Tax=Kaistella haifensis DSM 19056 TaxID=1450526 RepID=A0A246B6S6_9FLAO|nr:hypothetical protein [Kaistella haifensis]OWK97079.1 hypothetical protein AP75_13180 [Kaistella haifensis DSM 19056]